MWQRPCNTDTLICWGEIEVSCFVCFCSKLICQFSEVSLEAFECLVGRTVLSTVAFSPDKAEQGAPLAIPCTGLRGQAIEGLGGGTTPSLG